MLVQRFFGAIDLHRDEKFVSLRFRTPFRVISTCPAHGGVREGLDLVFNHQSCEPKGHMMPALIAAHRDAARYSEAIMRAHDLPGLQGAGLGTAANMHNLCIAEKTYRDLSVVALATGGVETNAARAGDPASYYEYGGVFEKRGDIGPETPGTINIIVATNTP
ncbi:MAG: adenosylcobinamide amidohydrolase, partial [Rhodospirillaceae bacterium]|nr:adenosylcobinamide amidohydrolase [Rhodospirillaceae bacterium]